MSDSADVVNGLIYAAGIDVNGVDVPNIPAEYDGYNESPMKVTARFSEQILENKVREEFLQVMVARNVTVIVVGDFTGSWRLHLEQLTQNATEEELEDIYNLHTCDWMVTREVLSEYSDANLCITYLLRRDDMKGT